MRMELKDMDDKVSCWCHGGVMVSWWCGVMWCGAVRCGVV